MTRTSATVRFGILLALALVATGCDRFEAGSQDRPDADDVGLFADPTPPEPPPPPEPP